MKAARIVVLAVALAAGGAAAFLIGSDEEKKPEAPPVAQVETTGVLIAKSDVGMDTAISSQDLQWQAWPPATTGALYTVRFGVSDK